MKSQEVIFQKSQKLLVSQARIYSQTKTSAAVTYYTPLKLNEKLLNVLNRWPFMEVISEQFL